MTRMIGQPRVHDLRDGWMTDQRLGNPLGVARRCSHAEKQCTHAAQQQPSLERTEDGSSVGTVPFQTRPIIVVTRRHERTREDIRVPVQLLGRRVHDQIGTKFERPGEHRRRHRAVRHDLRTGSVRVSATAAMSVIAHVGFAGVSTHTTLV